MISLKSRTRVLKPDCRERGTRDGEGIVARERLRLPEIFPDFSRILNNCAAVGFDW